MQSGTIPAEDRGSSIGTQRSHVGEILGAGDLENAIAEVERELPGWLWSVCVCHVSADCTLTPDYGGPHAGRWASLLKIKEFDEGIDVALPQPATGADAVRAALAEAKQALRDYGVAQ